MKDQFYEVVQLIKQSRENAIKSVNVELINLYWNIGSYIRHQLAISDWGDKTVEELANYVKRHHPELRGFNKRGLYRMKQFYETYHEIQIVSSAMTQLQLSDSKVNIIVSSAMTQYKEEDIRGTLLTQISWTHHLTIMSRCKRDEEIEFYVRQAIKERYTVKELDRQISAALFERTILSKTKASPKAKELHPDIGNTIKDNYLVDFINLHESHSEGDLQKGLVNQMKDFVLELGKDFLFISEEFKLQVGSTDFYVDLLFFHRGLQCMIAIELKTDKFKPAHLGQLNFYLEALDKDVKRPHENPSIGILLCKDKDNEVVEYALNTSLSPTLVAEYKTQLPDKKVLQAKMEDIFNT
jgi:predicted nuclease of restriction endonuclease-like (RecB) superfamily|tara:strand:- start:8416 stop:9477 length:1062 start_codon:yes stop_codon:yes gene_type:complete